MAIDWAKEDFARLFKRETDDDLLLSWQSLAVWHMFLKKCDKSGLIESRRGVLGLAAVLRIPLDVIEGALPELLEDGRIRSIPSVGFVAPNYVEANYTPRSNGARQADARIFKKQQSVSLHGDVNNGGSHGASAQPVDPHGADGGGESGSHGASGNTESRDVTRRHATDSDQIRSDQINPCHSARARGGGGRFAISAEWQPRDRERELAVELGLDVDEEAREFLTFWLGDGRAKKDWDQTFANRLLSQSKKAKARMPKESTREIDEL